MNPTIPVAIVGAGPYGLSIAAHLQAQDITCGIFGPPMEVWRLHMPKGMLLKSDGFASNLSDPGLSFTLKHFCQMRGIPYEDTRLPVAVETFIEYALGLSRTICSAIGLQAEWPRFVVTEIIIDPVGPDGRS